MNRIITPLLLCCAVTTQPVPGGPLRPKDWITHRFNPETVQFREVKGISERIANGQLPLNLKSFLELLLANSTEIKITGLDVYTAADQITAAKAPLDPGFTLGFNTLRTVSPEFNQISGAATLSGLTQNSFLSYQQLLPTGQTIATGFTATRNSTNSQFFFLNPNISGTLTFAVTQPLWRNRTNLQYRAPLQIARTQLVVASELSKGRIADLVAAGANQYWEAVRARDNIKVQRQTLDLAKKSYERDKQALDLGALATLDILQSETQVAERKRDLIQAEYAYKAALDGLRRLIGADLSATWRDTEIVLEEDPATLPPKTNVLTFEQALTAALQTRPELGAAKLRIGIDDLNARVARDQLRPKLDLVAQGAASGLNGNVVPATGILGGAPAASVSTGFGRTLSQVFGFSYPSYGGGIQFTPQFRNSAAQAQLADALVNKTRDRYSERQVQQQVTLEVRQAVTAIELAGAAIDAATVARDLAKRNVAAEQQKYELGSITAFEVLDSQSRLANAESALLNDFVAYQEAFVGYQRATWTLLDSLGMVIESPQIQ